MMSAKANIYKVFNQEAMSQEVMNQEDMNQATTSEAMSQATIDTEFPCLSSTRSKGKKVTKLVIPLKTYKEELCERYEARPVQENLKTRMCNSLDKNEVCRHGENCRFAHSLDELVIRDCHFKDRCYFVKIKKGKLVNDGCNCCRNKHPQESKDDFIERMGLSRYKTSAPTHEEIDVEDEPEIKHKEVKVDEAKVKVDEAKVDKANEIELAHWYEQCCENERQRRELERERLERERLERERNSESSQKEIVLRVPKVLAMQALELALNSGNRCIRVEVIDPMTLTDFDTLLCSQNANSSPGCSGITYGHLRAME